MLEGKKPADDTYRATWTMKCFMPAGTIQKRAISFNVKKLMKFIKW